LDEPDVDEDDLIDASARGDDTVVVVKPVPSVLEDICLCAAESPRLSLPNIASPSSLLSPRKKRFNKPRRPFLSRRSGVPLSLASANIGLDVDDMLLSEIAAVRPKAKKADLSGW